MVIDTQIEKGEDSVSEQKPHLFWMCEKCGDKIEGKPNQYLTFCNKHTKADGCNVILVNDAHEMVATNKQQAIKQGIFPPPKPRKKKVKNSKRKQADEGIEAEVEEKQPGKTAAIPKDGQPLALGFYKTERFEMDVRLFLYRDVFVQEGLVPADIPMGAFLLGVVETLLEITGRRIGIIQTKGGHN